MAAKTYKLSFVCRKCGCTTLMRRTRGLVELNPIKEIMLLSESQNPAEEHILVPTDDDTPGSSIIDEDEVTGMQCDFVCSQCGETFKDLSEAFRKGHLGLPKELQGTIDKDQSSATHIAEYDEVEDARYDQFVEGALLMASAMVGKSVGDLNEEIIDIMENGNQPEAEATNLVLARHGLKILPDVWDAVIHRGDPSDICQYRPNVAEHTEQKQ